MIETKMLDVDFSDLYRFNEFTVTEDNKRSEVDFLAVYADLHTRIAATSKYKEDVA